MYNNILTKNESKILTITLNRPQVKNAFNEELIAELTDAISNFGDARVTIINGAGDAFCAGGDINMMKKVAAYTSEQNEEEAKKLAQMFQAVCNFPGPVIGQIHGAIFGGGIGLVSSCDYVIASEDAIFSFSEAKLGLIPAVIGPFAISKIGESWARALFLSAERFGAKKALDIGLVHRLAANKDELEKSVQSLVKEFLSCSPNALKTAKQYIFNLREKNFGDKINLAAKTLAQTRASDEAKEGLQAFLEKRKPNWII